MNAQDFLTQLISGLQDGFVCSVIVSFVWFAACRLSAPAAAAESVAEDELPSLAQLFAMADALTAVAPTEVPQLQISATAQPIAKASLQTPVAAAAVIARPPSIRKLKALDRGGEDPALWQHDSTAIVGGAGTSDLSGQLA